MAQRNDVGAVYGGEDSEPVAPADRGNGEDGGPGDINQVGGKRGWAFTSAEYGTHLVGRQGEGCTRGEHISNRPWLIRDELRTKQISEARRRAETTENLAPKYMTTRWGVQLVELEQRIEVLKECGEAQAEIGQLRGWGLT